MVIADTGFWLALANRDDRHHARATERLRELREPLVTTWPVVTETCYLLLSRLTDGRDFRTYRWKRHEPFENLLLGPGGE